MHPVKTQKPRIFVLLADHRDAGILHPRNEKNLLFQIRSILLFTRINQSTTRFDGTFGGRQIVSCDTLMVLNTPGLPPRGMIAPGANCVDTTDWAGEKRKREIPASP